VTVERGERIAQGLLVQVGRVESWEETHTLGATRGGFGSTGTGAISTDSQAGGSAC
jgi:dUTPase